jgi:hypothetical protein
MGLPPRGRLLRSALQKNTAGSIWYLIEIKIENYRVAELRAPGSTLRASATAADIYTI